MKIGIITFQRAHNFGAQMQMYALYTYLTNQGHNVWILDYHCPKVDDGYVRGFIWGNYITKRIYPGLINLWNDLKGFLIYQPTKRNAFEKFLNENFQVTKYFENAEELPTDFDVLITGSDQVWNYDITGGRQKPYFLDNDKENVEFPRRISYAASVEKSLYPLLLQDKDYVLNMLSKFYWVSTREKSLTDFLAKEMQIKADTVIDPTLLLKKEDFLKIAIKPKEEHYLCLYRVSTSKSLLKVAKQIANERGLQIIYSHSSTVAVDKAGMYGPREQLGLILYADVVVTSSFHGTAFSIIGRKDFYAVYDKPSVRVKDLLTSIGLPSRMLVGADAYQCFTSVNYDETFINNYIECSKQLLFNALK